MTQTDTENNTNANDKSDTTQHGIVAMSGNANGSAESPGNAKAQRIAKIVISLSINLHDDLNGCNHTSPGNVIKLFEELRNEWNTSECGEDSSKLRGYVEWLLKEESYLVGIDLYRRLAYAILFFQAFASGEDYKNNPSLSAMLALLCVLPVTANKNYRKHCTDENQKWLSFRSTHQPFCCIMQAFDNIEPNHDLIFTMIAAIPTALSDAFIKDVSAHAETAKRELESIIETISTEYSIAIRSFKNRLANPPFGGLQVHLIRLSEKNCITENDHRTKGYYIDEFSKVKGWKEYDEWKLRRKSYMSAIRKELLVAKWKRIVAKWKRIVKRLLRKNI